MRWRWDQGRLDLLQLSSTILVGGTTTSLDDMVPLCPNCHKSIHIYYRQKLKDWGVDDFGSRKMAADVYRLAKGEIVA